MIHHLCISSAQWQGALLVPMRLTVYSEQIDFDLAASGIQWWQCSSAREMVAMSSNCCYPIQFSTGLFFVLLPLSYHLVLRTGSALVPISVISSSSKVSISRLLSDLLRQSVHAEGKIHKAPYSPPLVGE